MTRLQAEVGAQRSARTRATLGAALDKWLKVHEAEESTLDGYRGYIRRSIKPALGDAPISKITAQLLEEFYADLRRCRHRCRDGQPAVDHRTLPRTSAALSVTAAGPGDGVVSSTTVAPLPAP